ncbi:MAG: hypothetical protein HC889_17130 [Synechococcaceae cyanobacterium SM1_2_3]|nr:hypothetical protein [Synechococcaceae cyanobacterium SM1_2_3]
MQTFLEGQQGNLIIAVILALLGGFARVMQRPASITIALLLGRVIASAFAGITVFLLLDQPGINMDESLRAAITGIAGYAGVDLLDVLSNRLIAFSQHYRTNHSKDDRNANP